MIGMRSLLDRTLASVKNSARFRHFLIILKTAAARTIAALVYVVEQISSLGRRFAHARDNVPAPDVSKLTAFFYLALFVPIVTYLVLKNTGWSGRAPDTEFHVSAYGALERFSSLFSNAISNPLQGLFDIFPHGLRRDLLPVLIGRALFGPGMSLDFFLIFCGLLLMGSVVAVARIVVGMRWSVSVLAGFLLPLMILPINGPYPLTEHFYIVSPTSYYSTAVTVLITALYWQIDARSMKRFTLLTAAIILLLLHLSMTLVFFMPILAPAMVVFGIAGLFNSKSRDELIAKIACAGCIVVVLGAAGIFNYLYAIGSDTSFHVFFRDMRDFTLFNPPSWQAVLDDARIVIQIDRISQFRIDGIVAPLAQAGALYMAVFGRTQGIRLFGRTMIAWILLTIVCFVLFHYSYYFFGIAYKGPSGSHFIAILWPYYAICLASLVYAVAEAGIWLIGRISRIPRERFGVALAAVPLVFPIAAIVYANAFPFPARHALPFNDNRNRTPIVDFLQSEIGVALDRPFRGSALAMPTIDEVETTPYGVVSRDRSFFFSRAYLGNDMGQFGLWEYDIPTLNQFTENIRPQFHLTVLKLLSRPGIDRHQKHHTLITRLNPPIMELLGLRYLIADYELPAGVQKMAMPFPEDVQKKFAEIAPSYGPIYRSPLRVFELPDPNVGNYSPTKIVRAENAKAIIATLSDPTFDGREVFVTDDDRIKGPLVPATGSTMTVRMGGVAVEASSTAESVLVLPVQFSRCWQVVSGSKATLFRANLMQLGVRFSGDLKIELRHYFGPFWQSGCRLADVGDYERLDFADATRNDSGAVTINAPGSTDELIQGEGRNLIADAGRLDEILSNPYTQVVKVAGAKNQNQAYRLTATGSSGEHYTTSPEMELSPGPYTVSLKVRLENSTQVRLWLSDDNGTKGPIIDFDLDAGSVKVVRPDFRDGARAGFEKTEDGWYNLWISGHVSGKSSSKIFLWLSNEVGSFHFAPGNESMIFGDLQLEHGETASTYQPSPDKQE